MQKSTSSIFKTFPNPSIIFDPATLHVVEGNEASQACYDYSPEELNELSLFDLFPSPEKQRVMEQIDRFKEDNGYAGSWIQTDKQGKEFEVEIYLQTVKYQGKDRRIAHIYKIRSLEKEELTYHLSNSPLGFVYWNENFRLERYSDLMEKWTGYTFKEMHNRHARDIAAQIVPVAEQDIAVNRIQELKEKKVTQSSFEIKLVTRDNNVIHTHWYNSAEFDDEGNLKSVASMVQNISGAKEQQNKLQLTMAGGDVGFWYYYPESETIEIDRQWVSHTLGYDMNQGLLSTDEFKEMVHPDDVEELHDKMSAFRSLVTNTFKAEFRIKDSEGDWRWILSRAQMTDFVDRGKPTRITGINLDINKRKRSELQISQKHDQQKLLKDVAFIANENIETPEALKKCLGRICEYLDWEVGHYYELSDHDRNNYQSTDIWYLDEKDTFRFFVRDSRNIAFSYGEGLIGNAAQSGNPVWYYSDLEQSVFKREPSARKCGLSTGVILPVVVKDEVVALMEFYTRKSLEPEKQTTEILSAAASQVARVIERLINEQKLKQKEKSYRLIAENSTDVISRHSPDGTYRYISPASREVFGYEPEELIGTNPYESIHPDDLQRVKNNHKKVLKHRGVEKIAYRKKTKNDGYIWVESTLRSIWDEKELMELQVSTRDISDRKAYEKGIKQEKDFANTVIDSMPGLFYMIDQEGNYLRWNKNFEKMTGYSAKEIERMHPLEFYHEKDRERISEKIEEVFETGSARVEADIKTKGGELRHHYLTGKAFTMGGETFIVGSGVDIQDRYKMEQKLRKNEKLLEQLFQNSPLAVALLDEEDKVIRINNAFQDLFNYHEADIKGKNVDLLITPPDLKLETAEMWEKQTYEKGDSLQFETVRLTREGEEVPVLMGVLPVSIDEKAIAKYIIYGDITQRKQREQELKDSLEEKRTLLSEIHHRVKNNLAVISGLLQMQLYNTDDPEFASIVNSSINRIKTMALIHDKLYQHKHLSRVDFKEYIEELTEFLASSFMKERQVYFSLQMNPMELNINQAIPCALILNELISNAYEHAFDEQEEGNIMVVIEEAGGRLQVEVIDDGRGLPTNFYDRKDMGFTIVETLIGQLEADYSIESKGGTKVTFSFEKGDSSGSGSFHF